MCGLSDVNNKESVFFSVRDEKGNSRIVCDDHFDPADIVIRGGCKRIKNKLELSWAKLSQY